MARHTGFLPFAEPTARGCVPSWRARSRYVRVSPGGIARKAAQTRCWNGVPSGSTAISSSAWTSPAKYARTRSLAGAGARVPSNGSSKRKAWRAPPRRARWMGPIGVSTVSTQSMFTPSAKPEGGSSVGPPRSPVLRALEQSARRQPESAAKAEIGRGKCVGLTESAERHELRGPVADAGDFAERCGDRVEILRSIQPHLAVADAPGKLDDGVGPHRRHATQLRLGEPGWSRKARELFDQRDRHLPRARYRDLLAEDRPHCHLERIPRTRDAQSSPEERRQDGVTSQVLLDRSGVGAQIEDALDPGGNLQRARRQRRRHARFQMRWSDAAHFQPAFRQAAAPGAVADLLDRRQRARREEREQRLEIERRAKRQPQREFRPRVRGRLRPKLRGSAPEPAAHRLVEAAKAGEAGGGGDVDDPDRRILQELPGEMQPACAQDFGRRSGEMSREQAAQVAIGDAQPLREARRIAGLLEQAESARERGRGAGLGGRAGSRVGAAAEAGAVAGRLRGGCGRKKDDVFAARQTRRAAWTAIDVRRPHAEEEAAGEASIAALDRAVAGFGIHGGNE